MPKEAGFSLVAELALFFAPDATTATAVVTSGFVCLGVCFFSGDLEADLLALGFSARTTGATEAGATDTIFFDLLTDLPVLDFYTSGADFLTGAALVVAATAFAAAASALAKALLAAFLTGALVADTLTAALKRALAGALTGDLAGALVALALTTVFTSVLATTLATNLTGALTGATLAGDT